MSNSQAKRAGAVAQLAVLAFKKYAPELHRYIERRMRRSGSARDLTQDIFERFLQVEDPDAVRNPQAYLYGIASHVVREALFKQDRSLVTYDSDVADLAASGTEHATPEDAAEQLVLKEELQRALLQLPPMHRLVLLLVKREGLSYEEVAKKANLNIGTVNRYVFEARAKIKTVLKSR